MPGPAFSEALKFWFKLGWISFGGPAGQIAILHTELVEKKKWIQEDHFLRALNYCMLLPGPEAQQLATYCGWLLHGWRGGLAAGLLFILPAFLILGALSELYLSYHHLPVVAQVLLGAKAVVVAIILQAAWKLSRKAIRHWSHLLIAVGAWAALQTGGIPFPLIILGAGLLGFFHQSKKTPSLSSVVVRPSPSPVLWIGFALVWGLPFLFLSGILQTVALFFTKLALVTFGGAYAVLPYLQQEATEHYHWLSAGQMMDGLALGETTPGPLIMIVTYVGFWAQGWPGAATATYYTFLPSFFFILVGAPYIERWANLFWLERALQGITAAVIGFICALGFFFALHLFWIDHTFQGFPFTLSLIAWALLSKWNLNILSLVLGGGLLGWLWPTVISCFF